MLILLENCKMTPLSEDLKKTSQSYNRRRTDLSGDKTITTFAYKESELPKDQSVNPHMTLPDSDPVSDEHLFKIRLARTENHIGSASMLVQKMYATRGYPANPIKGGPMNFTLVAYQENHAVGTVTLALDSGQGLAADQLYKEIIDKLRADGRRIGELTKLAIDRHTGSKYIFGSLLHMAYIYARRIYNYTDVVLEIVPHHVNYYVKMLGCELVGEEKLNTRVNFPVKLLRLNGTYVDSMIGLYGGLGEKAGTRTLYAYFFSKTDEEGIMQRVLRND
jgi:hypothetical protein